MSAYKRQGRSRWAPCLLAGAAASLLMTVTIAAQEGPFDEESEEPPTDELPQDGGDPGEAFPEGETGEPTDPLPEPGEETTEPTEPGEGTGGGAEYPDLCSDTNPALYKGDCKTLQQGYLKYVPKYQLWADREKKERFIYLPGSIDTSDENNWKFPDGTILYKTFLSESGQQRFETRIIKKVGSTWTFATWGWKSDGTAESVTAGGPNWQTTGHNIPSLRDCNQCHRAAKAAPLDPILGFTAIQLNHHGEVLNDDGSEGGVDSSVTLSSLGLDSFEARATIPGTHTAQKALGYMYANCSHCHGGANPAGSGLDLSIPLGLNRVEETPAWTTAVCHEMELFAPPAAQPQMSKRIDVEDTEASAILYRMQQRGSGAAMPRLATTKVHPEGVGFVREWIDSINSCESATAP